MSSSLGSRHRSEQGIAGERADVRSGAVGEKPGPGRLTILVADDEPVVLALVGEVLQDHGYHVLKAVDGVEALEVAARHSGPIHLLLTDLTMPRLGGHELHHRLNHQRPETRTLFMSGCPDTGLDPAAAFLAKPFVARALVRKVREVLRIWVRDRQP